MQKNKNKRIHWAICDACGGQGKIPREPSKKRRLLYQATLEAYEQAGHKGALPQPPVKNLDVCAVCKGSGLQGAETTTPVDTKHFPRVAIVGGGIGGTALAVACLHRGIPFTLYERDEHFAARSQGYGLTLQQASKAIEGLGIFSLNGGITSTRHVVHNPDGKIIGEWGMRKWKINPREENSKRKNIHIARQTLRAALLNQLENCTTIHWGHKLLSLSKNSSGGTDLVFQVGTETVLKTADLVVGADGIRSEVRQLLIGEATTSLHYLGCIVILGICSRQALEDTESSLLDAATVFQTVNGQERIYVMPYDPDTVMWQCSFPLPETEAAELSTRGAAAMKTEVLRRLEKWHSPIPQMLANTPASLLTGYPVYDRALLDPTELNEAGDITLIGDAAHPMSPFKGQGANQALLDALNLARSIFKNCGPDSLWREQGLRKTLLSTFETAMVARTSSKVLDSKKAVDLLHSPAVLHDGAEPRGRGLRVDVNGEG